jgi:hypothetical protein
MRASHMKTVKFFTFNLLNESGTQLHCLHFVQYRPSIVYKAYGL